MFLEYSELLNYFDSGVTTKITLNNRRLNKQDFEKSILILMNTTESNLKKMELFYQIIMSRNMSPEERADILINGTVRLQ